LMNEQQFHFCGNSLSFIVAGGLSVCDPTGVWLLFIGFTSVQEARMACNVKTYFNRTPAGEDRSAPNVSIKVGEDSNEKQSRTPSPNSCSIRAPA